MKTITAILTVKVEVNMPDDVEPTDVINELDYNFTGDAGEGVQVLDTEIQDVEIKDVFQP